MVLMVALEAIQIELEGFMLEFGKWKHTRKLCDRPREGGKYWPPNGTSSSEEAPLQEKYDKREQDWSESFDMMGFILSDFHRNIKQEKMMMIIA